MKRLVAILVILASASVARATTEPYGNASAAGCPSAARCGLYRLAPDRWVRTHGTVAIHYRVNTLQLTMPMQGRALDAIKAAAQTWMNANPAVRLIFDGLTTDVPQLGDGVNEIAWVASLDAGSVAQTNHRVKGKVRKETDTLLSLATPWSWTPCAQSAGACENVTGPVRTIDLQAVMTHEFGQWLSLESMSGSVAAQLTMYDVIGYGERKQDTLALGDALAVQRAYACGRCRTPTIVAP